MELRNDPPDSSALPGVSIIMSTYNEKHWLSETIAAVLGQSDASLEFLIIDDASTDGTRALLAGYDDPRLLIFRHDQRNGWLNNMNLLASRARGKLLKFLCPDDVMKPGCNEAALSLYQARPDAGYIVCDFEWIDERGRIAARQSIPDYPRIIPPQLADDIALVDGCFANTSCLFVPRDKWLEVGGMREVVQPNPERWPTVEDYDLMVRLQERYPVGYIREPLVAVRTHSQQVQANPRVRPMLTQANLEVLRMVWERRDRTRPELASDTRAKVRRRLAREYFNPAVKALLRKQWSTAIAQIRIVSAMLPLRDILFVWLKEVIGPALGRRAATLFPWRHGSAPQAGR